MKKSIYFLPLIFFLIVSCSSAKKSFSWSKYTKSKKVNKRDITAKLGREILYAVDPGKMMIQDLREKEELEFLVFGDSGTGEKDQYLVGERMYEICSKSKNGKCDFALLLGDTIYPNGLNSSSKYKISDKDYEQLKNKFEKPYEKFENFDIWVVAGNHEWKGDIQAMINYSKESKRWKMPYNHYKIPLLPNWLNIYGLDTTRINRLYSGNKFYKDQINKKGNNSEKIGKQDAQNELCGKEGWKILFGHHGIYSKGKHGNISFGNMQNLIRNLNPFREREVIKKMKESLEPIIKKCGVQVFFAGHDHHQEHSEGYKTKYKKKILFHQVIQGAAGKLRKVTDSRRSHKSKITKFA